MKKHEQTTLRKLLILKGVSAKQLSEILGIKYKTMLKYSSGERNIPIVTAKKIGKVLDVDWWTLFDDKPDKVS